MSDNQEKYDFKSYSLPIRLLIVYILVSVQAQAAPMLDFPTADDLTGPVFVQPFAGLAVIGLDGAGNGITQPFFSDLPDGSLPGNRIVNILGNFQAFDPSGAPTAFDILGVEVTDGGSTFTPNFGEFDFAGNPSLTFTDSVDLDSATFFDSDFTLGFDFVSDAALDYFYVLNTDLPVGSFIIFDDVETGTTPEPGTFLLIGSGLIFFSIRQRRKGASS